MISSYPTTSLSYHISSNDFVLLSVCFWKWSSIWITSYSPTIRSTAGRDLPCPFCQVAAAGCTRDVAEATQEGQFSQVRASRQSEMGFASWVQCLFLSISLDPDDLINVSFSPWSWLFVPWSSDIRPECLCRGELNISRDVTVCFLMPGEVVVERVFDKCEPLS